MDPPNGIPPRPKHIHFPGETMFDPKSKEALIKNLVDTWGVEGFRQAAELVAQYEGEPTMPRPAETAMGQVPRPKGEDIPDLLQIRQRLIMLAQRRLSLHCHMDHISNDLAVLIHGQGTLWKDQKCGEATKGVDYDSMGLWQLLEFLDVQADTDQTSLLSILSRLDNEATRAVNA